MAISSNTCIDQRFGDIVGLQIVPCIFSDNKFSEVFDYAKKLPAHSRWRDSAIINLAYHSEPIKEEHLLTSSLEPTNEGYAIAKIAALKMCRYYNEQYGTNFMSVMPTNLYGINDNFNLYTSHVLPALSRKFCEAKINSTNVTCFGTGIARREFLYVDDLADACIRLMQERNAAEVGECVNVGCGEDISIKELAEMIAGIVGYTGKIHWDSSKPDGTLRKRMSSDKLHRLIDWQPKVSLDEGLHRTIDWFREAR